MVPNPYVLSVAATTYNVRYLHCLVIMPDEERAHIVAALNYACVCLSLL